MTCPMFWSNSTPSTLTWSSTRRLLATIAHLKLRRVSEGGSKKKLPTKKNGWRPLASFLHLRVLVPNRLHQTKHQAQDRPNIKPETQPHAAQALIPALQLIGSGTNFDSCIKSRTLRACCHCPPFSQALMAAL